MKKIIKYLFTFSLLFSFNSFSNECEITVIDSAIDFQHEYLKEYRSKYGVFDIYTNKTLDESNRRLRNFFGDYNHATHVAGIIASHISLDSFNDCYINGAYFVKVGHKVNEESFSRLESFIKRVNPRVANLSISEQYKSGVSHILKTLDLEPKDDPEFINEVHQQILYIFNSHMSQENKSWIRLFKKFKNVLFVIAAGNDSRVLACNESEHSTLPSTWSEYKKELLEGRIGGFKSLISQIMLPNTITVGSFKGDSLELSSFSNYGQKVVDILADGEEVKSTLPDGKWGTQSGTSMAAPQITGLAASILQLNTELSVDDLKDEIFKRSYFEPAFLNYSRDGKYYRKD